MNPNSCQRCSAAFLHYSQTPSTNPHSEHPHPWLRIRALRILLTVTLCGWAWNGFGADVLPGTGYATSFEATPAVADWATGSAPGSSSDSYNLDADVNGSMTAANVSSALPADPSNPPSATGTAIWSSAGQYVQTRPTGNKYTVLLGTFVNRTQTNATQITITYRLTIADGGITEETGTRAYYSLTGAAGDWVNIPGLNSTESNDGSTPMSATVDLEWPDGATLYLLWADDNAAGFGTDPANQIDDFALAVAAGTPVAFACLLDAPTAGGLYASDTPITTAARAVSGTAPYTVEYFTHAGIGNLEFVSAGTSGQAPYPVTLANLPAGEYQVYALATDASEPAAHAASATNTFRVADPLVLILTAPADGAEVETTTPVLATATVAGGTPPVAVQFYLDGMAAGEPVAEPPYTRDLGLLFVGDHVVQATAVDAAGWESASAEHSLHITGPLAAVLSPADGTVYNYGAMLVLDAFIAGGTAPYHASFYTNAQLAGTLDAPPFALDLGRLPVGTYACYVEATDNSTPGSERTTTSTNVITILPNPLAATLTSPTAGQNVATNLGFRISVAATVAAPVTVAAVDFFLDDMPVGTDETAPYSVVVPGVELGPHSVYARATDSLGREVFTSTNAVTAVNDPLANDLFVNRMPLTGPTATARGSNAGATTEGGEPTGSFFQGYGATLWWTWTAPVSGLVRVDTAGSTFDTTLGIGTGQSVGSLSQVAFNDNAPGQANISLVTFNAQAGTQYQIQLGGRRGFGWPQQPPPATGSFELHLLMPPAVTLTEPAAGSVFTTGSNFVMSATANSPHGPVAEVAFFSGETFFGTVLDEPYTLTVNTAPPGTNSLYAVVTDTLGLMATSAVVNVAVFNVGLTLVAPADGATFLSANPIPLRAVALLPTGTMGPVTFLVDDVEVGTDAEAPYSVAWPPTPGLHRISAVGSDQLGQTYRATLVWIAVADPIVPAGAVWSYLDDGSDQGTAWRESDFDDSQWASGPAELGYGDGDEATVIEDNPTPGYNPADTDRFITAYFRRAFVVEDPAAFTTLRLALERDDAGVVYLNGREVLRSPNLPPAPGPILYDTTATGGGAGAEDTIDTVTLTPADLVAGTNVFAVEIHQISANSSDLSFNLSLHGIPEIIRNQFPVIQFQEVANNQFFFAPADLVLDFTAFDPDGTITNLALFVGEAELASAVESPLRFALPDVPPGIYEFRALAWDAEGARSVKQVVLTVYARQDHWLAINDHYAGPHTHPFATAWNAFGTTDGAPGDGGSLQDIQTGRPVPSYLTVLAWGAMGSELAGAPNAGTPAHEIFGGVVDFGSGGANHSILVDANSVVLHLFTGLDPNRRYHLRATAVGGLAGVNNQWTLLTLIGAQSFLPAHSAGVQTAETLPGLLHPEDAALSTGDNTAGDAVGWDDIAPGPDGAISIASRQYLGPAPGNDLPGPYSHAPVAVRLEEIGTQPYVEITGPIDGDYFNGWTDLRISAAARAADGVTRVVFRANGTVIGTDLDAPYSVVWSNAPFATHALTAVVYDGAGLISTSGVVSVSILPPPENVDPPVVVAVDPPAASTLTNELNTLTVTFSEPVFNVDAADLRVNGLPALSVTGAGTQYTFSFPQPAYGIVWITWAAGHGITDFGWPEVLPFNENATGNRWNYVLLDRTPPVIVNQYPAAGATVPSLSQVTVVFSEPVTGVDAKDLIVRTTAATNVVGYGTTYTFTFPPAPYGLVLMRWATGHGITDLANPPNPFVGSAWNHLVGANTVLLNTNAPWRLFRGTAEASDPPEAWRQRGFADPTWELMPSPFYYGQPYTSADSAGLGTLLFDMPGGYSSIFLRTPFLVTLADLVTNLTLRAQSDDGFIAWVNGAEVYRHNVPLGELPPNATALTEVAETATGAPTGLYALPNPQDYLMEGTNWLAVQAFNFDLDNDDFAFEAQLYASRFDPALVGPGVIRTEPPAGSVFDLMELVLTFNEPVQNVDASDLLVNGQPATALEGGTSNRVYTFGFAQPAYGAISITWAAGHGITDFDSPPKSFNGAGTGSTWQYTLLNPAAPVILAKDPPAGTLISELSQIAVTFNEAVNGVDAEDLRINGNPATAVTAAGTRYTFTFPQPAYGIINITWAASHGIADTGLPPTPFNPAAPGSTWQYTLLDFVPPVVAAIDPDPAMVVTDFNQWSVTFNEAVRGVDATDLLVNGLPASSVAYAGLTYIFSFPQPNTTSVTIAWAPSHGITDWASPANAFAAATSGSPWVYTAIDGVPPSVIEISPQPDETVRSLTRVSVTFDEAVTGVDTGDLEINGVRAESVTGAGAGPYTFFFTQPETGGVDVVLGSGIWDEAATPNAFLGAEYTYLLDTNLPPPNLVRGPYLQMATPTSIVVRWRTETTCDSRVRYGLAPDALSDVVEGLTQKTEHELTLTGLTPYTRYYYGIGTTSTDITNGVDFSFRTSPTNTVPTRIWYVSDFGFANNDERSVRDSYFTHVAAEKPADVWITGGDQDQRSGTDQGYTDSVFGKTYGYYDLLRRLAVWPTIGNHDYSTGQGVNYYANFTLPAQGEAGGMPSGTEHYYSFDYANIHFVTFDGIDGTYSRTTNTPMVQWLHQDLAANTKPWVVAYWHGPPYSKGSHDSDSTTDTLAWMVQMRENIVPVLEAYGVDLVLCGHSHVHERTWLINGHHGFSSTFSETNKIDRGDGKLDGDGAYRQTREGVGTVYISNGVGGQPRTITSAKHPAHLVKIAGVLGSLVLDVNGSRLDCKYVNTTGGVEDYFTLIKNADGPPQIIISQGAGMATVSWPASPEGYELRHTTGMGTAAEWQPVTNGVQAAGEMMMFQFSPAANGPVGFFRLEKQP